MLLMFFSFGVQLTNKMKFLRTLFGTSDHDARIAVNHPNFKALEALGEQIYEMSFTPSRIKLDLPIQIGIQILNLAKLRMLQFVYHFISKFVDRSDYSFLQMDTDSMYLAISGDTLAEVIKLDYKAEYHQMLYGRCKEQPTGTSFLPRQCCEQDNFQDNKTPGILKTEWEGDKMICLASKTYVGESNTTGTKLTCKGANKAFVTKKDPFHIFQTVLSAGESVKTKNRGFRVVAGGISTYEQDKRCFPYFYCKREVSEDGVSTSTLKVTLDPVPITFYCIQTSAPSLSMIARHSFAYQGRQFSNCLQTYVYMKALNCQQPQYVDQIMKKVDEKTLWMIDKQINISNKWMEIRYSVMEDIVNQMFDHYPRLKNTLLETPNLQIVSASPYESYFNCGVNKYVIRWLKEEQLPGGNYYGKILQRIKER